MNLIYQFEARKRERVDDKTMGGVSGGPRQDPIML